MSFHNRLNIVLSESELSQSEVARRIGVGKSTITGWLNGSYEPNSENIYRVAQLFNVTEAWLLGYTDLRTMKGNRGGTKLSLENNGDVMVEAPSELAHYKERLFALRVEDDCVVEQEYVFEVGGEVKVLAYSEEHAEELFKQNAGEYLSDAYTNGDIDYQ